MSTSVNTAVLQAETDFSITFSMPGKASDEDAFEATLGKTIADVLGPLAWQTPRQTLGYRWRGEDSLTSGDLRDWILINWMRCLMSRHQGPACLDHYGDLWGIYESAQLSGLKSMYSIRDEPLVQRFLEAHPALVEVLFEAYPHLVEHFGPAPQIELKVFVDPEMEGEKKQLFANILTSLPVSEGLERLSQLDRGWFLGQLGRVGDLFNFDLEFV